MASLIDLLIDDLNNEDTGYNKLLDLSNDKTSAIVKGDVDELQKDIPTGTEVNRRT